MRHPTPQRTIIAATIAAALAQPACSTPAPAPPAEAMATSEAPSSAPSTASLSSAIPAADAPDQPTAASPDAAPPDAAPPDAAPPDAAEDAPLPAVDVKNIGMHIGGGPNDAPTKAPIKQSVEPHFDDFRRCFARVDDPKKGGDFGVDLRIEKDGGKASATRPRTALKGEGFTQCMIEAFERIDFKKPKGGTTVVSYSLRFTPK